MNIKSQYFYRFPCNFPVKAGENEYCGCRDRCTALLATIRNLKLIKNTESEKRSSNILHIITSNKWEKILRRLTARKYADINGLKHNAQDIAATNNEKPKSHKKI